MQSSGKIHVTLVNSQAIIQLFSQYFNKSNMIIFPYIVQRNNLQLMAFMSKYIIIYRNIGYERPFYHHQSGCQIHFRAA